ncbi:MAG: sugar kinase, partial [Desulfobacterota bacterium]|nr:sugar kinase [Thermodesulfobacteriota bacterium]
MNRIPQVFGLGQCSLDHLGLIRDYPPADTKCEFSGLTVQGGGPVATALAALSRWGIGCAFAGVIGDDHCGEQIRTGLEA